MNLDFNLLNELDLLESNLKCYVCNKKLDKPVRLKTCGHYFCENCLKVNHLKTLKLCPKCEIPYESTEIDSANIAYEAETILFQLKELFTSLENKSNPIFKDQASSVNTINYKKKVYHINFIDIHYKINAKGETPLHIACKKKKLMDVSQLLENKTVDINSSDFAGWVPLHEAIESRSYEIVETLLKHGALIDIPGEDYTTPLHKAASLEDKNIIKLLIEYGANKDCHDYFGKKPVDCIQNLEVRKIFDETLECKETIKEVFCNKKISVYFYYVDDEYKEKMRNAKVHIEEEYDTVKVSHFIIKKTHKPSVKIFRAMLEGCLIVPQEWVNNFLNGNYFIPLPTYEFVFNQELNMAIQKALMNFILRLPNLFDGIKFAIVGHKTPIKVNNVKLSKDSIAELIKAGGGKVLHRAPSPRTCDETVNYPYHSNINKKTRCCHFIIFEEYNPPTLQYQMAEIKHRSSKWLLDCILQFTIID